MDTYVFPLINTIHTNYVDFNLYPQRIFIYNKDVYINLLEKLYPVTFGSIKNILCLKIEGRTKFKNLKGWSF